jgi:hypothetical protein
MRTPAEALFIRVVVRRVRAGATPFRWEIHGADTLEVMHVSPDHFSSMEAAYSAGQARLGEFMPTAPSRPGMTENRFWRSRQNARNAQIAQTSAQDATADV